MMTAPKLAQIRFQVRRSILTFYFIAFGFLRAIEVIEQISARLVRAICDFIQHARTASLARNSDCKLAEIFHITLFAIFLHFFANSLSCGKINERIMM